MEARQTAKVLLCTGIVSALLGRASGFVEWRPVPSRSFWVTTTIFGFFVPALFEEVSSG